MNDRIQRLIAAARAGDIYPQQVKVEYDEFDEKLSDPQRIAKRLSEYMEAQPCAFSDDNELVGMIRFDGSVEGPLFPRIGHRAFAETAAKYYKQPQENLCTFEWQHSNADFGKVIRIGLVGLRKEIVEARRNYETDVQRLAFLAGLESMIRGIVNRSRQYAAECRRRAALSRAGGHRPRPAAVPHHGRRRRRGHRPAALPRIRKRRAGGRAH